MNLESAIKTIKKKLKEYVYDKKVIIGISGGIDSAVVAYLCTRALGKDKVLGVMMPYGNQDTKDSQLVVEALGIKSKEVNIKEIVDKFNFLDSDKLGKGNLMARTRMTMLYAFANQSNGLVIGTSNKSEIEVGYFTKYGDGGVDLEPIGDLYKTEIFEVAKILGVPKEIINKKPSAGLWQGQTDEDEMGITYKELDSALKGEVVTSKIIKRVYKLQKNSEHKRKLPPVFKVRGEK